MPDNAWRAEYNAIVEAARLGGRRSAWRQPGWVRHEAVLLDSPLHWLDRLGVVERRRVAAADLVHRALSISNTTRAKLGEAGAHGLRGKVGRLVAAVAPEGWLDEVVESTALIARCG